MDKILIVDDTAAVLQALSLLLEIHGYEVVTTDSPKQAVQLVNQLRVSLVIQDMNFTADTTSGEEGIELFHKLRELNPNLPIILITAWTDLEQAIELVKSGAADYIAKPWDDQKLLTSISNLIDLGKSKEKSNKLAELANAVAPVKNLAFSVGLIYSSHEMQRIVDMAIQVAKSDISVLITGANGAGKEKIAELVQSQSDLRDRAFIKVNCGALPADLIEAELFGVQAGAYTGANKAREGRFEAADGGTLFLDEIGNLSYSGQTKLLRVLQTGEFERLGSTETKRVNVRIISATNSDLLSAIANGSFREDLYYRLNVIELNLPSLANRKDDIMVLANHFLPTRSFSLDAEHKLLNHSWPGNVRELENACRRVAVLKPTGTLQAEDFTLTPKLNNDGGSSNNQLAREPTKSELISAIKHHEGVIARVARQFSMSRQALYRRLNKYGIEY